MIKTHTQTDLIVRNGSFVGTETFTVKFLGILVYRRRIPVVL